MKKYCKSVTYNSRRIPALEDKAFDRLSALAHTHTERAWCDKYRKSVFIDRNGVGVRAREWGGLARRLFRKGKSRLARGSDWMSARSKHQKLHHSIRSGAYHSVQRGLNEIRALVK